MRRHKGSITFETSVMNTEEVFLFIKSATESGVELETVYEDMKMIDNMLQFKRLHFALHHNIKYTRNGNLRKDASIYRAYEAMIESRITK